MTEDKLKKIMEDHDFVIIPLKNSQDSSFANGKVGEYIRKEFAEPSRWETKNNVLV